VSCGKSFYGTEEHERYLDRAALRARDPGFDPAEPLARQLRPNWLTLIPPRTLARLGGEAALRARLPDGVAIRPVAAGGLVLRAGELPRSGAAGVPGEDAAVYDALDRLLREPDRSPA
jgi:hypothetical protein